MKIRKTKKADITDIMTIIEDGRKYLASLGSEQWQNGYPNASSFENDIKNDESYVLVDENDKVIGCMALSFRGECTYDVIDGAWQTDRPYGVIHRIAIDNTYKGQGLASFLLQEAEKVALENNINSMRIDTHEKNQSMIKLINKSGYVYCGVIIVSDKTPRVAFEKKLD